MNQSTFPDGHDPKVRQRLFKSLGVTQYLNRRELIKLGPLSLHCELYRASAQAPCLIFIPGIGTYSELYCESLAKLSARGYNIISVDLRGHGYSGGERGLYQVKDVIEDLGLVIDYLQAEFNDKIGIFGCSIGGRLALAMAEADSRVRAILCHTLFLSEMPPDIWHMIGWSSLSFSSLFMPALKIDFRYFIDVDSLLQNNPMGRFAKQDPLLVWEYPIETLHSVYNHSSTILTKSLGIPSAVIIGSHDAVFSMTYTHELIRRSAQPFELIEITDAEHMLPFDQVEETVAAADAWFAKQTW